MASNYIGKLKIGSKVRFENSSSGPRKVVDMWADVIIDRDGHYETASDLWIELENGLIEPYYHIVEIVND